MPSTPTPSTPTPSKPRRNWLHYAAYFTCASGLVYVAQTGDPQQVKHALIAGAIASGAVVSRDWYNARLTPDLACDSTAAIALFNEMLHAGRAQANNNAAHLKRVEFIQTDLVEAMTALNNTLRQSPEEIEQAFRSPPLSPLSSLPVVQVPTADTNSGATHIPNSATAQQSAAAMRPGFDT